MNKRLGSLLPLCLLLAPLALVACGGGGEDADEVEAISNTIAAVVSGDDPSKCTELMTQDYVEQNATVTGAAAVEECEEQAASADDPEEVTVSAVSIDEGVAASAEVAFEGGGFDGQTLAVDLVKAGERWKLDRIAGFASYDPEAMATTLEERFKAVSGQITSAQIGCIGDGIREASEAAVEAMLLSGDPSEFVEFAEGCE